MRAAVFKGNGDTDRVKIRDMPDPVPGSGDVVVRVHAASLNSWDWDRLRGWPIDRFLPQGKSWKKLGGDFAGVVEHVGPNVLDVQPGQRVFGDVSGGPWGSFAEVLSVPAHLVAPLPDDLDFETAAAVPQAGLLALQGLRGRVNPGDQVLINGAGGGAGTFAIQLAKLAGAEVTGVDRSDKAAILQQAGADNVVDYATTDFTATGQTYDLVLDLVARRKTRAHRRALKPGGTYLVVGGTIPALLDLATVGLITSLWSDRKLRILPWKASPTDLAEMAGLVVSGKVKPVIGASYPLNDLATALDQIGSGDVQGKVVITIRP